MEKTNRVKYPDEFRVRAVRMVKEHRGEYSSDNAAYCAISEKLGCNVDTLRGWCKQMACDAGNLSGVTSEEKARIKALELEVRELRQANEILRKASAYFAQAELDRPYKKW